MKRNLVLSVASMIAATSSLAMASPVRANIVHNQSFADEWCDDVQTDLLAAIQSADQAPTDEDEVVILKTAIGQALHIGPPRFHKFFRYTLQAALNNMPIFASDPSREGAYLRDSVVEALDDLSFARDQWDVNDNGPYVQVVLARAIEDGAQAPQDHQEESFLVDGAERAMQLIEDSDFRRDPDYACTYKTLDNTLQEANQPGLGEQSKIILLRNGLQTASEQIGNCDE